MGGLFMVVAAVGPLWQTRAQACSLLGPTSHIIDNAMVGIDQTPPTLPQPKVARIERHDGTGCRSSDSCGDFVSVQITNLATDDMTPAEKIGYQVSLVAGSGFTPPMGDVDPGIIDGTYWLYLDGNPDDIDFTLTMVAIDAAGNRSAPQTVHVYEETGWCSIGHGHSGAFTLAGVVFLLRVAARRRRTGSPSR
jgi:hypothetical protein